MKFRSNEINYINYLEARKANYGADAKICKHI